MVERGIKKYKKITQTCYSVFFSKKKKNCHYKIDKQTKEILSSVFFQKQLIGTTKKRNRIT